MLASTSEPVALDAVLHRIADDTLDALVDGSLEPCVVRIADLGADGVELGYLPLDGAHPSDVLLGTQVPDNWHAVGTAARGWAYDRTDRHDPSRGRRRTNVVLLLSRSGEVAQRIHIDGRHEPLPPDEAPTGLQVDVLRRCLGLPTAPPPESAIALQALVWLGEIIEAAPDAKESWSSIRALHPCHGVLDASIQHARADELDDWLDDLTHQGFDAGGSDPMIARVMQLAATQRPWEAIRTAVARGTDPYYDLTPALAAWFDEGSFARHVLAGFPPLSVLEQSVADVVSPSSAAKISATLRAAGVGTSLWPDDVQ